MGAIELEDVGVELGGSWPVRGLTLEVAAGETFVLIGPSGCGKTTTLKTINRLVPVREGTVRVGGRDVAAQDPALLRRGIGYVIQDVGLFAHWTVRRNVGAVPELLGHARDRIDARVEALLERVGLPAAQYADRYPRELSGGQRQRVGIARALAADPPIVLLDEPFSALDAIAREVLQGEFATLARSLRRTFVLVTHDIFEAVRLADRIGVMQAGRLVQCGAPAEIVRRPVNEGVAALLGRHRHQLRLMTCRVAEVSAPEASPPPGAVVADVAPGASVWEALEAMEARGAALARVVGEGAATRYLSYQALHAAARA